MIQWSEEEPSGERGRGVEAASEGVGASQSQG